MILELIQKKLSEAQKNNNEKNIKILTCIKSYLETLDPAKLKQFEDEFEIFKVENEKFWQRAFMEQRLRKRKQQLQKLKQLQELKN